MTLLRTEQRADSEQQAKPRYVSDTGFWASLLPSHNLLPLATKEATPDEKGRMDAKHTSYVGEFNR